MALEVGIVLAIFAMLSYGFADFFSKKAVDRIGYVKSLLFNQLIAFIPLIVIAFLFYTTPTISLVAVFSLLVGSFSAVAGYLGFFKSLEKGKVSIVLPIVN